ncbi:MAG: hypothetical protein AABX51_04270 [Nanoarchaeota archaeon]
MNGAIKIGMAIIAIFFAFILIFPRNSVPVLPISPQINSTIFEIKPIFRWTGVAEEFVIDDNPSFTSPTRLYVSKTNTIIMDEQLKLRTYYWKLSGKNEYGPWQFTIQGKAALDVEKSDIGTLLKNTGNVDLNVIIDAAKSVQGVTSAIIVPVGKNRLLPKIFPEKVEAKEHEG